MDKTKRRDYKLFLPTLKTGFEIKGKENKQKQQQPSVPRFVTLVAVSTSQHWIKMSNSILNFLMLILRLPTAYNTQVDHMSH